MWVLVGDRIVVMADRLERKLIFMSARALTTLVGEVRGKNKLRDESEVHILK